MNNNKSTIILKSRILNNNYSKGSIFNNKDELVIEDNNATITSTLEFCIDVKLDKHAVITSSIPFIMSDENKEKLNYLIHKITFNKDYLYNENHYIKQGFDPKKYKYYDFIINNKEYEIDISDEIIEELITVMNSRVSNQALINIYNELTN